MLDELVVDNEKTAKILSDPLRQRILRALVDHGAQTSSGLSRLMGLAAAKLHYHLGKLEAVGLVELDREERINGIAARYLRAVARSFRLTQTIVRASPAMQASVLSLARSQFDEALLNWQFAIANGAGSAPSTGAPEGMLVVELLTLSQDDAGALQNELQALLAKYNKTPAGSGESWHVVISAVPAGPRVTDSPNRP